MPFWYLYNKSYYHVAIVTLEKTGNFGNRVDYNSLSGFAAQKEVQKKLKPAVRLYVILPY